MTHTYDVLINGGGPVGMGLAIELGQRGIRTCVIERYRFPQPIPKGQNLTQRTAEHFQAWGCEKKFRDAHPLPPNAGIGGMTIYGTLLSDYAVDWFNRGAVSDYYFAQNVRVPQYKTEAVLRARAAEIECVTLLYGWTGTSFEQDDDEVRLTIRNKDTGESGVVSGCYLVGADGSRSMVRGTAGIPETRRDHDRLMALLVFDSEQLHDLLKRYPRKAIYKVLHPDQDGYWMFFGRVDHGKSWFFHAPVPADTTTKNYDFSALLHRAVGQKFDHDLTYVGLWDLRIAFAENYRAGRVFVAGDAAHSHPPYGGYGINTGLEDARNLGWKLAGTLEGWGGERLLDSYTAERQPVFASTARDFIERYIEKDRKFLRQESPEHDAAKFTSAWNESQSDTWDVDRFEPHYEGSPIVPKSTGRPSAIGTHNFTARLGHHLPPAGPGGRDAAAVFGRNFTLLTSDEDAKLLFQTVASELGIPLEVPDAVPGWLEAWQAKIILVRPDGFAGWTGDQVDQDTVREILQSATGRIDP